MAQSGALKLALLAGFCLLVGLHLPSPWRSSWPAPVDPQWERGKMAAPEGGCSCSSGAEDCCPGKHKHDKGHKVQVDVYGEVSVAEAQAAAAVARGALSRELPNEPLAGLFACHAAIRNLLTVGEGGCELSLFCCLCWPAVAVP